MWLAVSGLYRSLACFNKGVNVVCPSCLNTENDKFSKILGHFVVRDDSRYDRDLEIELYACQKCSAVRIKGDWSFDEKVVAQ